MKFSGTIEELNDAEVVSSIQEPTAEELALLLDAVEARVRSTAPMILPLLVSDLPNEGIGFVWPQGISHLRNQAQSPKRFSISPVRLSELIVQHDDTFPEFMYHSHPRGEANLSSDDWRNLRFNWYEGAFRVPWVVFPMRAERSNYADWKAGKVTGAKAGLYTPDLYRTIHLS